MKARIEWSDQGAGGSPWLEWVLYLRPDDGGRPNMLYLGRD